jgi:deoxyribose-phosphate aldolase
LKAVTCLDLTTLAKNDTPGNVLRLCAKNRQPVQKNLLEALGMAEQGLHVGAICVYHNLVFAAVAALAGSGVPVAAVFTGFPVGQTPLDLKIEEIRRSVEAGVEEIDIVVFCAHVLTGNWRALYDEVCAFREACNPARMKTIVAAKKLGTLRNLTLASHVCLITNADFIKTSTGKKPVNATLPFGLIIMRAVRDTTTGRAIASASSPRGIGRRSRRSTGSCS